MEIMKTPDLTAMFIINCQWKYQTTDSLVHNLWSKLCNVSKFYLDHYL